MKTLAASLLAVALVSAGGAAQARVSDSYFSTLADAAPRAVFDDLNSSAPRSLFDDLDQSAPRSPFDQLQDSAPRAAPESTPGDLQGE